MTEHAASPAPRRGGVRLRSPLDQMAARAPQPAQPLVSAWLAWLNDIFGPSMIGAAAEEAQQGRLASLFISDAKATAVMRGGARPSAVNVHLPALSESQWGRLIDQMAGNSAAEANLLAGQMPTGISELAVAADAPLAPNATERPTVMCDPSRSEAESERASIVVILCAIERMIADPRIVFALRGRSIERVLEQLRDARHLQLQGASAAHGDPLVSGTLIAAPSLAECVEDFWGSGTMLTELEHLPPAHHAPHALLRRLGPSPLGGKFPLAGLLASVYDVVSEEAKRLRDSIEQVADEGNGQDPR